nr:reverse transcriptase domain-containing protein [Tanacetum cinerariifolium]
MRLQAIIDKKKVIITKATIQEALRLDNAESIDCLPNEEIFTELSRMGCEKPSTKLTFYKERDFFGVETPLFKGMIVVQQADDVVDKGVAHVDVDDVPAAEPSIPSPTPTTKPPPPSQELPSTSQVIPTPPPSPIAEPSSPLQQQQSSQPIHDAKISMDLLHTLLKTCITLTKKVEDLEQDKVAQALEIIKLKQRVKKIERKNKLKVSGLRRLRKGEIIANIDADKDVTLKDVAAVEKTAEIEENTDDDELELAKLKEVVEVVTTAKLMTKVVTAAAAATITAATTLITVATITTAHIAARRRKKVVIRDPEENATPSIIIHSEPKSKDKGKGIMVKEPKPLKKQAQIEQDEAYAREYQALKRKPQTEAQARKNMMIYLRNMAGFKMYYFKGMNYDDIHLIFEKYFNLNVAFLEKSKEHLEEEESRALKRKTKSFKKKATKKQKLDEEVEELKKHLQIMPNNDDDVYTEATPLALKVPIVDYEIYTENNKPYFKIIRAGGSYQLFLSFLVLLRNFDREDLEVFVSCLDPNVTAEHIKQPQVEQRAITMVNAMVTDKDIKLTDMLKLLKTLLESNRGIRSHDEIRRDKRKEVHARLDFREGYRERRIRKGSHYSSARTLSVRSHSTDLAKLTRQAQPSPDRTGQTSGIVLAVEATLTEIHNIKKKDGETIEDFMERFKVETEHMKGAPKCMRISGFMHGVNNPELTKRLNEHVPKTMEEMMITTTVFIRGEATAAGKKKGHTSWRTQDQSKPHPLKKRYDFQGQPGEGRREITFPSLATSSGTEGSLVIEAKIGGHIIHRMYVDGGSSTEVLYEYCFNWLQPKVKNQMVPTTTSLTGFSGETIWLLGQLRLLVKLGEADHSTRAWMNFMIMNIGLIFERDIHLFGKRKEARLQNAQRPSKRGTKISRGEDHERGLYPLPKIDLKVESLYGYPFKCFTDAYKGYHQIQLTESDEEKMAFHTGQGLYCYTKMPFGLKNAGTTYQRLSHTEAEMLRDIDETFHTLRKINMKLNLKKFTFGALEGMFLGYMITPEGIQSCPDKTEAVLQISSPWTIKEVQSLNEKLASLNRFLFKSAEKSLPLFKTLKKSIKKSNFHWTSEAEQAFKQLKQHLSELPLLVAPKPKEELIVYMSASYEAISAVLMIERGQFRRQSTS